MALLELFIAFSRIGLFSFGGGETFIPLIEREIVQNYHWLDRAEFLEVLGITRAIPGAISAKFATYVGYKIGGVPGAVVANIANLLPAILFMVIAMLVYSKYKNAAFVKAGLEMIQYAVVAMIIVMAIQLVDKNQVFHLKYLFVIVASFLLFFLTKIHPAFIIIGAALYGVLIEWTGLS